jgi:hypothetical protein
MRIKKVSEYDSEKIGRMTIKDLTWNHENGRYSYEVEDGQVVRVLIH